MRGYIRYFWSYPTVEIKKIKIGNPFMYKLVTEFWKIDEQSLKERLEDKRYILKKLSKNLQRNLGDFQMMGKAFELNDRDKGGLQIILYDL